MNLLKDYVEKQYRQALTQLNTYVEAADPEALHKLRVSLKKLRAVINFFVTSKYSKAKKLKKYLRLVFRDAGSIRDLQLMKDWLLQHKYHKLIAHSKSFNLLAALNDDYVQHYDRNHSAIQHIAQKLLQVTEKKDSSDLSKYAFQLRESVEFAIVGVEQGQWHELRKQIKQLLYSYHWLSPANQLQLMKKAQFKYYDSLQEAIGQWNDAVNRKGWLESETFFLNADEAVRKQYNHCFNENEKLIRTKEKMINVMMKKTG